MIVSCNQFGYGDDSGPMPKNCDESIIIDEVRYKEDESDMFSILDAKIYGDCLEIKISASGCNGDSWEIGLIDSGMIAESFPEQRFVKVSFKNSEECLAVFTNTISFDLTRIRTSNNVVYLNLSSWSEKLLYEY
ncbi:MAG: hypothetical protein AAFX53_11570 [Bacteroidota bacterium]